MQQIHAQASDLSRIVNLHTPSSTSSSPGSAVANTDEARAVIELSSSPSTQSSFGQGTSPRGGTNVISSSKRARGPYVAVACDECRRRKGKCSGGNPCRRCARAKKPCLYTTPANRDRRSPEESERIENLVRQDVPSEHRLDVSPFATRSIQNMQIPNLILEDMPLATDIPFGDLFQTTNTHLEGRAAGQVTSAGVQGFDSDHLVSSTSENLLDLTTGFDIYNDFTWGFASSPFLKIGSHPIRAPDTFSNKTCLGSLLQFDHDEIASLCRLYSEKIGSLYPVIDVESLLTLVRTMSLSNTAEGRNIPEPYISHEVLLLKLVICCALAVEGKEERESAARIYEGLRSVSDRMLYRDTEASCCLNFLVATYHIIVQDNVLARKAIWRLGHFCLGGGLHLRLNIDKIQDDKKRKNALNTFWTVYVLDRQLELNTGLPSLIAEHLIDTELPLPDRDSYLFAVIAWTRICAKVSNQWSHLDSSLTPNYHQDSIDAIDSEILQWYATLPEQIKIQNPQKTTSDPNIATNTLDFPKLLTFFKFLEIRILLHGSILCSSSSIIMNSQRSRRAVSLAKHTIRYLTSLRDIELDHVTKLFYPRLLLSAIAILFLDSVYAARAKHDSREDLYAAIGLTAYLPGDDWLSHRLWEAIQSLKNVAPRYGFDLDEDQSTTAASMIGRLNMYRDESARGEMGQISTNLPSQSRNEQLLDTTLNGQQIQTELLRVVEAYTSLNEMSDRVDITIFLIVKDLIQGSKFSPESTKWLLAL